MYYRFWGLQQKDIDEGLPEAVNLAYKGALSREKLIALLTKVHYLKTCSISMPCEIDYSRIETGLKDRINAVKKGILVEPKCHTFATNDQIDPDAHSLYSQIDKMDDKMAAWQNRSTFICYLVGELEESSASVKGLYIEEFDDDLLSSFQSAYSRADNYSKREYADALLGLVFDLDTFSSEENISKSKQNLARLADWLKTLPDDDAITTLINRSFIEHIYSSEIMKSEQ